MIKITFKPEEIFALANFLKPWHNVIEKNLNNINKQAMKPLLSGIAKIVKEAEIGKEVVKKIQENSKRSIAKTR